MRESGGHDDPLARFQAERQRIMAIVRSAPSAHPDTRRAVVVAAAWLDEANDRLPRLLAGGPAVAYDVEAFAEAALARRGDLAPPAALGWFRRSADRFETMAAELTPAEIAEEPEVAALLDHVGAAIARSRAQIEDTSASQSRAEQAGSDR